MILGAKYVLSLLVIFIGIKSILAQEKPNVVLIVTDDQGYGDLSINGNPYIATPNIDKLITTGVAFSDFHVTPMCTPTRGQLLTGVDAARNKAVNVSSGRSMLSTNFKTLANYFLENGYQTGIFGKWHLGDSYPYRPQDRGFNEVLWFPSSHINSAADYWNNNYFDDTYRHNNELQKYEGYCTDVFFNESKKWMKEKIDAKEPFFTYIPTNAAHWPHWVPEEDIERAKKNLEKGERRMGVLPLDPERKERLIRFLAMIGTVDRNLGHLMNFLNQENILDNTILVFLTDNGSTFGPEYFNAGMRGKKRENFEGGHRVPLAISYGRKNFGMVKTVKSLTTVQDIVPTLIELCNLQINQEPSFDGFSLVPLMYGKQKFADRSVIINYSRMPNKADYPGPNNRSIMTKDGAVVLWKKWRYLNDSELFNLETDPLQKTNISGENPEVKKRMSGMLDSWWDSVKDSINVTLPTIIVSDQENPAMLSASDWVDVALDQQLQIRQGVKKNSYWKITIAENALYKIELRRWPKELNLSLSAGFKADEIRDGPPRPGVALPISKARLRIGSYDETKKIKPSDAAVIFEGELKKGDNFLQTWFYDESGSPITGAYYVYVTKK